MRNPHVVLPKKPLRLAIAALVFAAAALFVLFMRAQGFAINAIIGFTGFTACLLGLIGVSIALSIEDRRRDHGHDHGANRARTPARRVTPRAARSGGADSDPARPGSRA